MMQMVFTRLFALYRQFPARRTDDEPAGPTADVRNGDPVQRLPDGQGNRPVRPIEKNGGLTSVGLTHDTFELGGFKEPRPERVAQISDQRSQQGGGRGIPQGLIRGKRRIHGILSRSGFNQEKKSKTETRQGGQEEDDMGSLLHGVSVTFATVVAIPESRKSSSMVASKAMFSGAAAVTVRERTRTI